MAGDFLEVARARIAGEDAARAEATLVLGGAQALRVVLGVCAEQGPGARALLPVVRRATGEEARALLVAAAHAPDPALRAAALAGLARSGDPGVLPLLLERVEPGIDTIAAARALGSWRGEPEPVRSHLRGRLQWGLSGEKGLNLRVAEAEEEGDATPLLHAVELALACARLHDHGLAWLLCALSRLESDVLDDAEGVRLRAAWALRFVLGPGVGEALADLTRARSAELVWLGIGGLRLLGWREALDRLVGSFAQAEPEHLPALWSGFWQIAGTWPLGAEFVEEVDPAEAPGWWAQTRGDVPAEVCLRGGVPFSPALLIERLGEGGGADTLEDLEVVTGLRWDEEVDPQRVLLDPDTALQETLRAWWQEAAVAYPPGRVARCGRVSPDDAVRACFDRGP